MTDREAQSGDDAATHANEGVESYYVENRARLLGFIRSKVHDDALAEDILQDSLLRALRSASDLQDSEKFVSWLYRIIRNAITDAHRRAGATQRKLDALATSQDAAIPAAADEASLCACLEALIPTLKPEYQELVESMELGDVSTEDMTARLGITANNLKVRRHRARAQLRDRLERTCRTCAEHGCLDCTCAR